MENRVSNHNKIKDLVIAAVLIAFTVVISRVLIIPVPMTHGYINLCDAGIFVAAFLLGPKLGGLVGGATGFLLDLLAGYGQYMMFSLVVHGLEGLLVGLIANKNANHSYIKAIAMVAGVVVMVVGYLITDSILYTPATGLVGVPMNILQGIAGAIVAVLIYPILKRRI